MRVKTGRRPGRPRKERLPITAAELDTMSGNERAAAEIERSEMIEQAVALANANELPQLGGELPEIETGPR